MRCHHNRQSQLAVNSVQEMERFGSGYDVTLVMESRFLTKPEPGSDDARITLFNKLHAEDQELINGLEGKGFAVQRIAWDDDNFEWHRTKVVVVRATFDYVEHPEEWAAWVRKVGNESILLNPAELILWNMDKRYLLELGQKGINVPATYFVKPGQSSKFNDILTDKAWKQCVLKPCISASGRDTYKVDLTNTHDRRHGEELLEQCLISGKEMMVQRYQDSIVDGEVSIICIEGEVLHAVIKIPQEADFRVQPRFGGSSKVYAPSIEEKSFSKKVLQTFQVPPTYARVDILRDNDKNLCLMEIELIEPYLWLQDNATTVAHFVTAVESRVLSKAKSDA